MNPKQGLKVSTLLLVDGKKNNATQLFSISQRVQANFELGKDWFAEIKDTIEERRYPASLETK
jgi:hypothetical protein